MRIARLCAAMRGTEPPSQPAPGLHLYANERPYAVRPARRMEYFGPDSGGGPACYASFGRPLFRGGGGGALMYMSPARGVEEGPSVREWQTVGAGRVHLTNVRFVFESEDEGTIDFPFDAITWTECFADGIGLCTARWAPMYFQTPYPEWLYAFYRFLAANEVAEVTLTADLDGRARMQGM